eukprot:7460598-Heterocapsa_arctica.AAC.1
MPRTPGNSCSTGFWRFSTDACATSVSQMLPHGLICRLLQLDGRRRCVRLPPSLAPPVLPLRKL